VNAISRDAEGREPGGEIVHEGGRSADIIITIVRQAERLDRADIQASGGVEIDIGPVRGIRCAVADVAVAAG
jgi:hypothetical protein